jgi:hypothetical protein
MKSNVTFIVVALLVPVIACANEQRPRAEAPVIARVGAKEIHYRDIRCDARFQAPPEDPRCHALEQQKLDALMTAELVAEAARIHGLTVSDEEVLASAPREAVPSDAQLEQFGARFKAMAQAVLEVRDGASADEVFAKELAAKGITRPEFTAAYAKWNRQDAQKALTYDYAGEAKRQVLARYRTTLLLRRISALAAARASEQRVPPQQALRDLWRDVVARSGAKVVDTRYSFPDMERL